MDKLRDLILDLTKNRIAKKKQMLATDDNPKNVNRLMDLEQIDALDMDDSVLAKMQRDPELERIKKDRLIPDRTHDFGFPELQRSEAKKRVDKYIKDEGELIGTADDYRSKEIDTSNVDYMLPLRKFNTPNWRFGSTHEHNAPVGKWLDQDLDNRDDQDYKKLQKFRELQKKLKGID